MSVCLVMIAKDEEAVIGRCLRSALPHVDHVVLCDTGSTDATMQIARSFCESERVSFDFYRDEWVNFGHNRSLALERAKGEADYLLLMDADMTLVTDGSDWFPPSGAEAYSLEVLDPTDENFRYRLPALIRGDIEWRSEGATHEALAPFFEPVAWSGWSLVHWCDGARRPVKFEDDLRALQLANAADPSDPRTAYYLANTHRDLGNVDEAIHFYSQRIGMGGWQEEVYDSLFNLGCLWTRHRSFAQGATILAECHRQFPHRAEPLRAMAFAASHIASELPVPEGLFVDRSAYV